MIKQTVEEAAKGFASKEFTHEDGPFSTYEPLKIGFDAGAAWQREQGIDWIDVSSEKPLLFTDTAIGGYSVKVLVTDGLNIAVSQAVFRNDGGFIGWLGDDITPTHWAYINLPKTDK